MNPSSKSFYADMMDTPSGLVYTFLLLRILSFVDTFILIRNSPFVHTFFLLRKFSFGYLWWEVHFNPFYKSFSADMMDTTSGLVYNFLLLWILSFVRTFFLLRKFSFCYRWLSNQVLNHLVPQKMTLISSAVALT